MSRKRRIRGRHASASLKRGRNSGICPRLTGIRGRHASASLKLAGISPLLVGSIPRIRGRHASASLKHVQGGVSHERSREHPRQTCLGLIEACASVFL